MNWTLRCHQFFMRTVYPLDNSKVRKYTYGSKIEIESVFILSRWLCVTQCTDHKLSHKSLLNHVKIFYIGVYFFTSRQRVIWAGYEIVLSKIAFKNFGENYIYACIYVYIYTYLCMSIYMYRYNYICMYMI